MRDLRQLNINEGGKPVNRAAPSSEAITSFQARFGIALPDEYLSLLRHSNGGHPEQDSFEAVGKPGVERWAVDHFYHLDSDKSSSESLWAAMDRWQAILGKDRLVFAEDGGGNQFFLDLNAPTAAVKACVHDKNFAIVELAPSFELFIDGLSADPDMI
jgi:hypothetical protein